MSCKHCYINNIKENTPVEDLFLVKEKNSGMTRNGKPYLALILADKTGEVKGRVWDNAEKLGTFFNEGDIARIKSYAILYKGVLQLDISAVAKYTGDDSVLSEFLPASANDLEKCFKELKLFIHEIENTHLRSLIETIFDDDKIVVAFKTAPAAKTIHHDYLGGLLEHTLKVTQLAVDVSKYYKNINRDTLLAGAILHDIGKIYELSYDRSFAYTDAGRLVGHIMLGVEIITEKIKLLPDR